MLDALEQALYDRKPSDEDCLIHHSDRGSQYLSIRYGERLAEVIHRRRAWKTKQAVELTTLEGVSWFNHNRLMGPLRNVQPAESRKTIINNPLFRPRPSDLNQMAFANSGAVQASAADKEKTSARLPF